MSCEIDQCEREAVARFTWPGREELQACAVCALKAKRIARAMGLELEVRSTVEEEDDALDDEGLVALAVDSDEDDDDDEPDEDDEDEPPDSGR